MRIEDYNCKHYIDCDQCNFREKGCLILSNQVLRSEKEWIKSVVNTKELKADKSFILKQMLLFILAFAKRKNKCSNIHKKDIETYCLAGEDTYLIDCLWLCIQYGEIDPARILSNYIYEKYGHYIYRITSSLSNHIYCSSDEILQRVYLSCTAKQYKTLTGFKGENSSFKTYLTIITKYKISECLRNVGATPLNDRIDTTSDTFQTDDFEISPDQKLFQKEFIQFLESILIDAIDLILNKKILDVHILFWRMKGKSFQFIAKKLGIEKSNTVSHRYHRAKERIINFVKQQLRIKYQASLNDLDPDDIYVSIKKILQKKLIKIEKLEKTKKIIFRKKLSEKTFSSSNIDINIKIMESEDI
ncbi:hypothetical protein MHK_009579 [Candidatus Magnetomorum sp. HK-1]|nr:hypothetical protein MHK_009579 [Candidatus Magnetomorum sp. HK-1]